MRRNLFLEFLNRDSREIYGLYQTHSTNSHIDILRRALNAAIILCEDHCYLPPGFLIEDDMAFGLAEAQRDYLSNGALQFPLREGNLADYAEKKRHEYQPMRNRYSGLFDDNRLDFISRNATGLVRRKTQISEAILAGWREGVDTNRRAWKPVKLLLPTQRIEEVRDIPRILSDQGTALTWSAISPRLAEEAKVAQGPLRNALQHTYFAQYCLEFKLLALAEIPNVLENFDLPREPQIYNYRRLQLFLNSFGIATVLLDSPSSVLSYLKPRPGFIAFVDAFAGLAGRAKTNTDLQFHAGRAAAAVKYEWHALAQRLRPVGREVGPLELAEFEAALDAAATQLTREHGLPTRLGEPPHETKTAAASLKAQGSNMAELVLFVALAEELDLLAKALGLRKNTQGPAATGNINGTTVHVLCPRAMGRVPAAVAVATYLERRQASPPKLLLIVGLAGGFEESKTEPGHIICATTVVDLAQRKIEDDGGQLATKFRRHDFNLELALRNYLESDDFDSKAWEAVCIEAHDWPKGRRPSIHAGTLASLDEVVANDDWRKKLLAHTEKLLGVEMEAGGVCAAASNYKLPTSMLRVVSDKADPAKADDAWRSRGMKTLAELLKRIDFPMVFSAIG